MRVVVTVEQCFDRTPDGAVWSSGPFTASFWERYLVAFEQIVVVARVRSVAEPPQGCHVVSCQAVKFLDLPPYSGAQSFLWNATSIRRKVAAELMPEDAVILRIPSPIAACVTPLLRRDGHPYAVEVVGDAYNVLSRGSYTHPLRPVLQWLLTKDQRQQCAGAAAAAYVTRETLQASYPCREYSIGISDVQLPDAALRDLRPFTTHYSSVELNGEAFVAAPPQPAGSHKLRLVTVASLAQLYKAPDVLIRAVAQCRAEGLNVEVTIVGDGRYRCQLEELTSSLGMASKVTFAGQAANPDAVRAYLDRADLFVLPSLTEGLPRAMIEAMARGLPCIGSRVGGIPELLAAEDLVDAGSVSQLAAKITEMASSPERLFDAATRNYKTAQEYREDVLGHKREEFYCAVRQLTERWAAARSNALRRSA